MNNSNSIAFVGVREIQLLDKKVLEENLTSFAASFAPVVSELSFNGMTTPSLDIKIGGREYSLFAIASPIPRSDLAVAIQTAYGWKGAADAVAESAGHWVVNPLSLPGSPSDAYEAARDVTTIVAALIDAMPVNFVYWAGGDVISAPKAFKEASMKMLTAGLLPMLNWVQLRLLPGAATGQPGLFGVLSVGLGIFGQPELRLKPEFINPHEAFKAAIDLVAYILPDGAAVNDRDTVEIEGGSILTARRATEGDVELLEFSRV